MPTVAPKMPRDMSVGLAGAPVLVFSLVSVNRYEGRSVVDPGLPATHGIDVDTIRTKGSFWHVEDYILFASMRQ